MTLDQQDIERKMRRQEFGVLFKSLRSAKGLTIEGIALETRISQNFLNALESGEFERLPGRVFGRGFVRNVAKLVDCDENEITALYDACWQESLEPLRVKSKIIGVSPKPTQTRIDSDSYEGGNDPKAATQTLSPPSEHKLDLDRSTKHLQFIENILHNRWAAAGTTLLVFLVAFGIHKHFTRNHATTPTAVKHEASPTQDSSVEATTETPTGMIVDGTIDSQNTTNSSEGQGDSVSEKSLAETSQSDVSEVVNTQTAAFEQTVEIRVREPVTVKARIDGGKQEFWDLRKDVKKFAFQDQAELMISDGSAVEIIFNNKSLGVLGSKGRMRRLSFQTKAPTELP